MRRPPQSVVLVARTHALVGLIAAASIGLLHVLTRKLPVQFGPKTYFITGGFAAFYLLGAVAVWFGLPIGRVMSRICGLLYLSRPRFGSLLWELMSSADFKAHFHRDPAGRLRHPPP